MADTAPPQLGDIPQHSEMHIPTLSSTGNGGATQPTANGNSSFESAKSTMYTNAASAVNTMQNHPYTQNVKNTVANGPVGEHVKDQHAKTTAEFRNLADSRTTPSQSTATGQPLTHYHSFFYNLLSWDHPRATAVSFATVVLFIFAVRYLPVLRWTFRILYTVLGITAAAEVAGKLVFSQGLASSFRPRRYYTIPREALEACLEDFEQLINFFVIEFQRILFAENPLHTGAAFLASFISYFLIKFTPVWGLTLISTSVIYLTPLIYKTNKEVIDTHVSNAQSVVNAQAKQVSELASHHTTRATSTIKTYAGDYTHKAQEYLGSSRGSRANSPEIVRSVEGEKSGDVPIKSEPGSGASYNADDFPHAPKQDPIPGVTSHEEQYQNSQFGGQAEANTA